MRDGHWVFGVDKRPNTVDATSSTRCSRTSRATTPPFRGGIERRRVARGRPRRPPRRAREGAPARPPAAARARERDDDLQRPRVLPRARAAARLLVDARGVRRRPPLRRVRRGDRRLRLHGEPVLGVEDRLRGVHLLLRHAATACATSSSASRTSTAATTTTCSGWSACCRSSSTSSSRGEPITVYGGDEKVLDFTYIDDCVDGIARGIERLADGRVENETINLAFGQGNTLVRAAELIAGRARRRRRRSPGAVARRRGDALRRRHPQGARAARLAAADAARRGHPARGRLVPRVARGASRGGPRRIVPERRAGRDRARLQAAAARR